MIDIDSFKIKYVFIERRDKFLRLEKESEEAINEAFNEISFED